MTLTMQNIRILSLVVLTLQTSAMVLLLRYSRTAHSQHYIISTAILLSESLKLVLSLSLLLAESGYVWSILHSKIKTDVFNFREAFKLALPAGLYVLQNNLLFVALTNLDAATYQVTYQLKILTTAIFSWVLLGKRLSILHWFSLSLLMIGVSLAQTDDATIIRAPIIEDKQTDLVEAFTKETLNAAHSNPEVSWLLGVFAVLVSCVSSGFSGVYFERLVKRGRNGSLGVRSLQLGMFSMMFALAAVYGDRGEMKDEGFFQGYTKSTWAVITIQAFGGMVVAVTVKYADNILKGFATSFSIIISTLISWGLLGDRAPSVQFVVGASIVIGATFLYSFASSGAERATGPPQTGQEVDGLTKV